MKFSVCPVSNDNFKFSVSFVALMLLACMWTAPTAVRAQAQTKSASLTLPPLIGSRSLESLVAQQRTNLRMKLQPFAKDYLPTLANPDIRPIRGQATGRIGEDQPAPATASVLTSSEQTIDLTLPAYADSTALGGTGLPIVTAADPTGATVTNTDVVWSSANDFLVFASNGVLDPLTGELEPPASVSAARFHLFAMYVSGSQINFATGTLSPLIVQLTTGSYDERYPSLLGLSQIAYCTDDIGGVYKAGQYELVTAPLDSTNGLLITQSEAVVQDDVHIPARHPFYSGTTIVYSAQDSSGIYQLFLDTIATQTQTQAIEQLTSGPADNDNPNLSDQGYLAWDSNAGSYSQNTAVNPVTPLISGAVSATGIRNIYASASSGVGVQPMTTTDPNGVYSNEHPVWTLNNANPFVAGGTEDLFFDSNRPSQYAPSTTVTPDYTIYYYNAFQSNALVDEASSGTTVEVNTSDPANTFSDTQVAVSPLTVPYIAVAYVSNRYINDHNYDNPLALSSLHDSTTVTTALTNGAASGDAALDQEPTNVPTVTASGEPTATEILISRLEDVDPPSLIRFDEGTEEIAHVFAGAYSHASYQASLGSVNHYVPAGDQATFVVRLSDRQTGVGQAWLQIKDPESAYQNSTGIEHKVYTQYLSTQFHPDVNEATTLFGYVGGGDPFNGGAQVGNDGNAIVAGNQVELAKTAHTIANSGTTVSAAAAAGATTLAVNGPGNIIAGDAIEIDPGVAGIAEIDVVTAVNPPNNSPWTLTLSNATFYAHGVGAVIDIVTAGAELTTDINDGGGTTFSIPITPAATSNITQFNVGDVVGIYAQNAAVPSETAEVTAIVGNNTLVVDKAVLNPDETLAEGIVDNYLKGQAFILRVSKTAFDPSGQEVDCQAVDTSITPVNSNGIDQVSGDPDSYHIPDYTPGVDDAGSNFDQETTGTGGAPSYWLPLTPLPAQDQDQNGGVLYYGTWTTPLDVADYYLDVVAEDASAATIEQNGENWRIYDNVWGFTTRNFQTNNGILIVNDYALPQKFFSRNGSVLGGLSSDSANGPASIYGTESYWTDISNDVADWETFYTQLPTVQDQIAAPTVVLPMIAESALTVNGALVVTQRQKMLYQFDFTPDGLTGNDEFFPSYLNGLGVNSYYDPEIGLATTVTNGGNSTIQATSQKYDIWRILARGPIPYSILSAYGGSEQIQPPDPFAAAPAPITNFVAPKCIVWLSPYSGDTYVGAGTITDPTTQANLEEYINAGGRIHVEGKDIGFALTDNGASQNDFYDNYLNNGYGTANKASAFLIDDVGNGDNVYNLTAGGGQGDLISHDAFLNSLNSDTASGVYHEGFLYPTSNMGIAVYTPPNTGPVSIAHHFLSDTTDVQDASLDCFNPPFSFMDGFNTLATSELTGTTNREVFYETKNATTNDISSIVSYSSFGLATISQQVSNYAVANPDSAYAARNIRSELIHNVVCTLRTGSISGTIKSTQQGGGFVAGVIVEAIANGTASPIFTAKTNSSGVYKVDGLAAGRYSLSAYKEGYTFQHGQGSAQDVHGGDTAALNLTITPAPNGSLLVHVDDIYGDPIYQATVTVTDNGGGSSPSPTLTDNTGTALFSSIPTGIYTVTVSKAGYVTYTNTSVTINPGVQTILVNATTPVVLQSKPSIITGQITNALTGKPIVGATVVPVNSTGVPILPTGITNLAVLSGANGDYTITIPGGAIPNTTSVYILAGFTGYANSNPTIVPGTGTITPGGTYTVNIALQPQATLNVTVLNSLTGAPVQNVSITATGVAGSGASTTPYGPIATDKNGVVSFSPVLAGKYTVVPSNYTSLGYAFVVSTTPSNPITTPASVTTDVVIQLQPSVGTLTGTVTDAVSKLPIVGAVVTIVNTTTKATIVSAATGANGTYSFSNIPDGTYSATASATNYTTSTPVTVTITTGTTVTQSFALQPTTGSVSGTVTSKPTGLPISGALVSITVNGKTYTATTIANGTYKLTGIPIGAQTVTASAAGFVSESVTVTITGDGNATQNFQLEPTTGALTGVVTSSATGLPLPNATVSLTVNGKLISANTNASGVYSFGSILVGTYTVTASAPLYDSVSTSVTVVGGETVTQNFVLPRTIVHTYPPGLQLFSAPFDYNNYTLAQILTGSYNQYTGAQNQIAAWLPLQNSYVLTPTPPCDTIHDGQGYWGRFYPTGGLLFAGGTTPTTKQIVLQPGWNMIGDPFTTSYNITGIEVFDSTGGNEYPFASASSPTLHILNPLLYTYNESTNSYVQVSIGNPNGSANPALQPYIGYWIEAYTTCALQFSN